MYCIALMDFGLTPEYINENWTEELLVLMLRKRAAYIRRQLPDTQQQQPGSEPIRRVSDVELFANMGKRTITADEFKRRFGGGSA